MNIESPTEFLHETSHEYANKFSQLSNMTTANQF
jgi:hypothetical protein